MVGPFHSELAFMLFLVACVAYALSPWRIAALDDLIWPHSEQETPGPGESE